MISVTREELKLIIEAGERRARRMGIRFVLDWSRIKIVED